LWQPDLQRRREPPYPIGPDALFVAYYASAEFGCHLVLGWPLPIRVLDLCIEFKHITNGLHRPHGADLIGALLWYGLDAMDEAKKRVMQELASRGGPWTVDERQALLDYCESDVLALARLLPSMLPQIDMDRAVLCRGRYMKASARMEDAGVPIDMEILSRLRDGWEPIKSQLIQDVDSKFGVYVNGSFNNERWASWLARHSIPWPRLESGALDLEEETFRGMARVYPDVSLMHELRVSLSKLRLQELEVGADGRNRRILSAFSAKTSRNQPSNTKFIFGPACWIRGLIKPEPGRAVAYVDWSQQEFGIGAALSDDVTMIEAYSTGDPYLAFGKQAGRIPLAGTKETHGAERDLFKACVLGVQYGMGAASLAGRIGKSPAHARELLRLHRETYPRFWRWSDGALDHAMLRNRIHTVFGWTLHIGPNVNPRSIRNFPCQANGAELLRLACCLATERGIEIHAPVHDALLVGGPADEIDAIVARTQEAMAEASRIILGGFELRSDAKIVRWPDRYMANVA
jgi:DNA polymerase I-like protein with 3'-5' exonuclease and polymerase domains